MAAENIEMLTVVKSEIVGQSQEDQKEAATAPKSLALQAQPWSGDEIQAFIHEWELLDNQRGRKNAKIAKVIAQRLKTKGILRSRKQCLHLLENLQEMYWTIHQANQRPRSQPLPCPFGEVLHRLLGPPKQHQISDPPCELGVHPSAPEAQPPVWGPPGPFERPLWMPPPVLDAQWMQLPTEAQWTGWQPSYPTPPFSWFPLGLPAFVPLTFVPPVVPNLPTVSSPPMAPSPLMAPSLPMGPSPLIMPSLDGSQPLDCSSSPVAPSLLTAPSPQAAPAPQ